MFVKLSCKPYINGLVQDCSNSIANTLELLRYCTTQHSHNIIQYVTTLAAAASVFWCCFATWEINTKMTLLWVHKQFATWVHNQSMFYQVKIYISRNKMWKVWTYTRKYRNVSRKKKPCCPLHLIRKLTWRGLSQPNSAVHSSMGL